MKTIHFTITQDGKIHFDAQGFTGQDCQKAIEAYLRQTGLKPEDIRLKPEYYHSTQHRNELRQGESADG